MIVCWDRCSRPTILRPHSSFAGLFARSIARSISTSTTHESDLPHETCLNPQDCRTQGALDFAHEDGQPGGCRLGRPLAPSGVRARCSRSSVGPGPHLAPEMEGHFRHVALFIGPNARAAVNEGRAEYVPVFLHDTVDLSRWTSPARSARTPSATGCTAASGARWTSSGGRRWRR